VALAKATVAIDDLEMEDFSQAARGLSYFFNIKTAAPTDKVIKVAQFADKRLPHGKLHAQAHAGCRENHTE